MTLVTQEDLVKRVSLHGQVIAVSRDDFDRIPNEMAELLQMVPCSYPSCILLTSKARANRRRGCFSRGFQQHSFTTDKRLTLQVKLRVFDFPWYDLDTCIDCIIYTLASACFVQSS